MRGTQRVGSLLRLFLCAAFLCLAWVLFSSAHAEAAERPAPAKLVATVAKPITAPTSVAAAARAPAHLPGRALGHPGAAAVGSSGSPAVPVVEQLRVATAASVDAGVDELKAVAAAVPFLEAPVVVVADAVVTVADALPVVGRDPLVGLPLPGLSAAPLGEAVTSHADPLATHVKPLAGAPAALVPRGLTVASFDSDLSHGVRPGAVTVGMTTRSAAPEPSDWPEPFPAPQSPMPPLNSVPNPGGGPSSGDLASIGHAIVLPRLTLWGSSSSDWRVPRGLPAQPGSRPD
jgi:hypothetical protein